MASHICRGAVCLLLAAAAFWSIRLAWADYLFRTNLPANIRRAAELVPFHPLYQARSGKLRRAVELNPFLSSAWLELAHQAEAAGNLVEAERCLRQAASVDQQFEPRWALANFYFRSGRSDDFWRWIRLAAERSHGDRSGLYRLCWRMTDKSSEILERAIPPSGDLLADYLQHLVSEGRLDAAVEASSKLLLHASREQEGALMGLCERLIAVRRGPEAARIWNGMVDRGWLPYHRLDSARAVWLTNADLQISPLGKGFDWRLLWRAGVASDWIPTMHQIRIELTGKQMEETDLVQQFVPALPAGRYSFHFRYRTQGLPVRSGLRWRIRTGSGKATESEDLASEDSRPGDLEFSLPRPEDIIEITLFYRRAAGTSRAEGSIWLESGFRLARVGGELAEVVQ